MAAASAALFMGASPAQADNGPHVSTAGTAGELANLADAGQGRCASCHRAHTAKAPLLLVMDQESLCFSCHGTGGTGATTNVEDGIAYGAASFTTYPAPKDQFNNNTLTVTRGAAVIGGLRGGGFKKSALDTANASKVRGGAGSFGSTAQLIPVLAEPVATTSNHLGGEATMWGNGAFGSGAGKDMAGATAGTTKLECASCHDPHGNGNYRILRPVPVDAAGPAAPAPVVIPDTTAAKVYTTDNYQRVGDPSVPVADRTITVLRATSFDNPTPTPVTVGTAVSPFLANSSAWCTTCHTRYLANGAHSNAAPGENIFTYRHTSDRVNSDVSTSNRNCVACHVAHGSNAQMDNSNVEWPSADPATATKSQDSRLLRADDRGVCVMCHNV